MHLVASFEQGSPEWHAWRKTGIGGSDAAVIMGVSPWSNIFKLWEQKVGVKSAQPEADEWIYKRGHWGEELGRSWYEKQSGDLFPAACGVDEKDAFRKVSLDGMNLDGDTIIEVKLLGASEIGALQDKQVIPDYYKPQLQHNLSISGADRCIFIGVYDNPEMDIREFAAVEVVPDGKYIAKLMKRERTFWGLVERQKPPKGYDEWKEAQRKVEFLPLDGDEGEAMSKLVVRWKNADAWLTRAQANMAEIEEDIKKLVGDRNVEHEGLRINHVDRKGSIDYKSIPALKGIDLEQYRKAAVKTLRITFKEKE